MCVCRAVLTIFASAFFSEWEAEQQFGALYTLFIMVGKNQQPGVEIEREASLTASITHKL